MCASEGDTLQCTSSIVDGVLQQLEPTRCLDRAHDSALRIECPRNKHVRDAMPVAEALARFHINDNHKFEHDAFSGDMS